LLNYEKDYTPCLAEMQAMKGGMDHFDTFLRGRKLTVLADHNPLEPQTKRQFKTMTFIIFTLISVDRTSQ
jgi:hypothetical protein